MMLSYATVSKCVRYGVFLLATSILILGYQLLSADDFDDWTEQALRKDHHADGGEGVNAARAEVIPYPILVWWTPFTGEQGATQECGNVKCFFTIDRHYQHHNNTKVFMFYGTDYSADDLPLPRLPHHEWGLLHEESPKNNYLFSHQETMVLFNHTSTFRRHSDYPITTQYLEKLQDLETTKYMIPVTEKNRRLQTEDLALVAYIQSDCGTPSDRDHLVQMLQRHIRVDSYGTCLQNKKLPEHLRDPLEGMMHEDFYHYLAQYKFVLALENAVCEDYITEKFWRPFISGNIPIVFGSPRARDFLPSNMSAIFVEDFKTVEELVEFIVKVNKSDTLYNKYLSYKQTGVQNAKLRQEMNTRGWAVNEWDKLNFIDGFACQVCERVHENIRRQSEGLPPVLHQATKEHYGCPKPKRFKDFPPGNLERVEDSWWGSEYDNTKYKAEAALRLVQQGEAFGTHQLLNQENLVRHHNKDHDYH